MPVTAAEGIDLLLPAWYDILWTLAAGLVLVVPVALAVWVVVLLARRASPTLHETMAAARRHAAAIAGTATVTLVLSLLIGLSVVAARPLELLHGLLYGLVPAGAGVAFAVVHAIGERTWPRPTGTVRRAPLVRRTRHDVAPGRLRRTVHGTAVLLVVTLVIFGVVADGRAVSARWPEGEASSGPFPGWYYGVPLLVATFLVLAATEAALALVAGRPAVVGLDHDGDLALRRLSAHRLLRGCQLVLGITATGLLLVAGSALLRVGDANDTLPGSGSLIHLVAGGVALLAALVVFAATFAVLTAPAPRLPATAPRAPVVGP